MTFTRLVPSVFYENITDGLRMFVDCLHFTIEHQDLDLAQPYCVLGKDGTNLMLFQDKTLAKEHYPELRLQTNDIEEVYTAIIATHGHLLHPNLSQVTRRPWGALSLQY